VKSTRRQRIGPFKSSVSWSVDKGYWVVGEAAKRRRKLTSDDADLLALFHLQYETVVFHPIIEPIEGVQIPLSQVRNAGDGATSLAAAVAKLKGRR